MSRHNGPPRVILLTGSPACDSLTWSDDVLEDTLLPAFVPAGGGEELRRRNRPTPSEPLPAWRAVPLEPGHLPTGLTQASGDGVSFEGYRRRDWEVDAASSSSAVGETSLLTGGEDLTEHEYYEHSFILHDQLPSSQIVESVPSTTTTSFSTGTEYYSFPSSDGSEPGSGTSSSGGSGTEEALHVLAKLQAARPSDLRDLPTAAYLHSITPQTVTVNLVVGVILAPPPRRIRTRREGRMVDLVELLVGDETRSGFGINIWLPPAETDGDARAGRLESRSSTLREQVLRLRPHDVILASRVALNSFRGTVYGQSLRKGMTSLEVLHRHHVRGAAGDRSTMTGGYALPRVERRGGTLEPLAKVQRTQEWVLRFVAGPPRSDGEGQQHQQPEQRLPSLPPDTPTSAPDLTLPTSTRRSSLDGRSQ